MHFSFGVLLMNMTNDEYRQYSDSHQPRSKCLGNCLKAFLVGGLILFCLGIVGEYLSKMYVQVKNRPVYIVKEHLNSSKK